jgi:hypothetical protein
MCCAVSALWHPITCTHQPNMCFAATRDGELLRHTSLRIMQRSLRAVPHFSPTKQAPTAPIACVKERTPRTAHFTEVGRDNANALHHTPHTQPTPALDMPTVNCGAAHNKEEAGVCGLCCKHTQRAPKPCMLEGKQACERRGMCGGPKRRFEVEWSEWNELPDQSRDSKHAFLWPIRHTRKCVPHVGKARARDAASSGRQQHTHLCEEQQLAPPSLQFCRTLNIDHHSKHRLSCKKGVKRLQLCSPIARAQGQLSERWTLVVRHQQIAPFTESLVVLLHRLFDHRTRGRAQCTRWVT